jgi:predicted acetyltransferase
MSIEIREVAVDAIEALLVPVLTCFGVPPTPERAARIAAIPELDTRVGAFDGDAIVGTSGSFTFDLTVPGGAAMPIAGLTLVGVLPTHRRRGVMRAMVLRHLEDVRRRGLAVSALFASEAPIYGRFGYGLATWSAEIAIARHRTALIGPPPPASRARLLDEDEATEALPAIWDRVRPSVPGMLSRSRGWWRARRTSDPDWLRAGRPPLQRVLIEIEGRPAAYALYRFSAIVSLREPETTLDIVEAIADSPGATRALYRYLFDIDIVTGFRAMLEPVDHPLLHMLADPRRLGLRVSDGMWVRIVDVGAALAKRAYRPGEPVVIRVADDLCPWNVGQWRVGTHAIERTLDAPDLVMDIDALGAAYLGGVTFGELSRAGRVHEASPGAIQRGDALFRGERAPSCPEIF